MTEHVVDAHGDQVNSDCVMNACPLGNLQLRPHSIGSRDQHWLLVGASKQALVEVDLEETGEAPLEVHHPGREGPLHQPRQA